MSWAAAPITGSDLGVKRAEIRQGVREVVLCKDMDGKIGLRLKVIDNVFLSYYEYFNFYI